LVENLLLQFTYAFRTYVPALVNLDVVHAVTKDAGRLIFLENDSVLIHKDLNRVFTVNVQNPTQFDW